MIFHGLIENGKFENVNIRKKFDDDAELQNGNFLCSLSADHEDLIPGDIVLVDREVDGQPVNFI